MFRTLALLSVLAPLSTSWAADAVLVEPAGRAARAAAADALVLELQVGSIADVEFPMQAALAVDGERVTKRTFCRSNGDHIRCRNLGDVPLVTDDVDAGPWQFSPSAFTPSILPGSEVDGVVVPADGETFAAKFNFLTLQCELEQGDHSDCASACRSKGYDGGWAEGAQVTGFLQCDLLECICLDEFDNEHEILTPDL